MTEAPRIVPTFRYRDPAAMIDWLDRAFGFTTHARFDEGGRVLHAELAFGGSLVMLGQAGEDAFGRLVGAPGPGNGTALYLATDDPDALCARARAAGAVIEQEPVDRDYGSREFVARDPEGLVWCFGTYWPKAGAAG
jgi:uncharacterized glyoxalase superfamily protein PhnB